MVNRALEPLSCKISGLRICSHVTSSSFARRFQPTGFFFGSIIRSPGVVCALWLAPMCTGRFSPLASHFNTIYASLAISAGSIKC